MEIIRKHVHEEKSSVTVEFDGEGGDVVSLHMKKHDGGSLNRLNAEDKAKAVMVQIATFNLDPERTDDVRTPTAQDIDSTDANDD